MKRGHTPLRTCIGCRKKGPKHEMVRMVMDKDTVPVWDRLQNLPSRGAYLCPRPACLEKALKHNRIGYAFRRKGKGMVTPDALLGDLKSFFNEVDRSV